MDEPYGYRNKPNPCQMVDGVLWQDLPAENDLIPLEDFRFKTEIDRAIVIARHFT